VVAPQVPRDLRRAEVTMLTQMDDLADHLGGGGVRAGVRPVRAAAQALGSVGLGSGGTRSSRPGGGGRSGGESSPCCRWPPRHGAAPRAGDASDRRAGITHAGFPRDQ
jgi:hypothetical protein